MSRAPAGPRRIFLLAGEPSGDLQAALVADALRRLAPEIELWGVGGPRMEASGVRLIQRSDALGVVGFLEVIEHIGQVGGALARVSHWLGEMRPDLFVPVDYPDFNFRLLPRARRLGIPIVWYIGPQLWAWRPGRIDVLRRYARRVVVLFPFEAQIYRAARVPVTWVGHPLVERLTPLTAEARAEARSALGLDPTRIAVALLPGSRRSEISRLAPILTAARKRIDQQRLAAGRPPVAWIVGRAARVDAAAAREIGGADALCELDGARALALADLAVVASGTATLEAALLETPSVVVYRTNALTFALARRLVRVPHIAMANLVAEERVFPELLQDAATPEGIADALRPWLDDSNARASARAQVRSVRARLGPPGAADRAARAMLLELRR